MGLARQQLDEHVIMTESFSVKVYAVMNEQVAVTESFLQSVKAAIYFRLGGRKPSRFSGGAPGREG